jgi:F-type H+-transporting ATPase subunit delta
MISENIIVKRYALALFINMEQLDQVDEIFGEINQFFDLIKIRKSVEKLLLNKFVPKKTKMIFCNTILSKTKTSDLLRGFIKVLIDKQRLYLLKKVVASLEEIINKKNNIKVLELILAKQLDDNSFSEVKDVLMKYFNDMNIKFNITHNSCILGGMIIKKESLMLDLSLLSRIKKIEFLMKDANLKLMN